MKIQLTFKTPDVLETALEDTEVTEYELSEIKRIMNKYVKWGEYLNVVIDTCQGTLKVVQHSK